MNLADKEARKGRDLGEQPKANITPSAVVRGGKKQWLEIRGPACLSFSSSSLGARSILDLVLQL